MKKVFLIAVIAALFTTMGVNAQGLKGTWFAGGNLSMGSSKSYTEAGNKVKVSDYAIMPLAGKFVTPSLAIGGAVGYVYGKEDPIKTTTFIIQPLVRQYWNIAGKLYAFGQVALPIQFGNEKNNGFKTKEAGVAIAFAPGLDLIVNSWLTIEASFNVISFGYENSKPDGGKTSSNFKLNGNMLGATELGKINIGVKVLF